MEYKIQAVKLAKEPGGEKAASAFLPPAVAGLPKAENDIPALKTKDSIIKGKISLYCRMLRVARRGFNKFPSIFLQ